MNCDVSVIVPTYNSSRTLKRALDSVYAQSLLPREIVVVDDGSDDWEQSRRTATSCHDSIAVRFFHMDENRGPSAARNAGIAASLGRYVAFLDSDDAWHKDKLAIQYELMTSRDLDFSMHQYGAGMDDLRWEMGNSRDISSLPVSPLSSWTPLFRNDNTSCVMVLKQKMVLYDTSFRRGEDFICYMQLLSKRGRKCRGAYIRRVLACAFKSTIGVSGLSQDVRGMHLGRMFALKKLAHEGTIGMAQYLFGIWTEMVKYPIRVLMVWLLIRPRTSPPLMKNA